MKLIEFKDYLTTKQLSELLNLSEQYVNQKLKHKIENVHIKGTGRRWNPKSIEHYLELHTVQVK